jgi:hypothetical protein
MRRPLRGLGQEQRFAATHDLNVAAAPLVTPVDWDQKVQALVGAA